MKNSYALRLILIVIITASIFIYDLVTPHGMAVSLLYLIPFSLSGLFTRRKFAFAFAGVTTALVIAGYFLASAPTFPVFSEINRALTILTGWGILAALIQRNNILHQLSETNMRLQAIFDCSPNGMVALDSNGKVLAWSKGAQKIFGYEPQEVIGRPYPLIDGNAEDLKKLMAKYLEGNRMMAEVIRKRKDGTRIPTLLSTAPLKDARGTVIGVLGILMDLTEKKRAEAEIEKANAKLKAIFECAPVAIIALDPEGKVLDWNRGATDIFGYEASEVIGRPYPIVAEEDSDSLKKNLVTLLGGKSIYNMELPRKRKDGKIIQALGSGAPLRDAKGYVVGAMVAFYDLTEKKKAAADIERLNIEVAQRAMIEREREDLSAMIIHDLKSPLTAMMAYTDMLIENRIEDKKEALSLIRHGSEKILGMVEDYLTVYRSHAGKLEIQTNLEEIENILRGLEKDFHALAEKKDISLNFAFASSPKAVIDKKQFSRAVSNLVENAIKFTPMGGSIMLSVEASESDFTVSVSDTGPGILPEERESIFQKHYRSRMAMGTRGAGLGLAIVKAIAEAHGGKITFENNPGSGSTFKLTIPLRQDNTI